uniref:Secreted protein n=1 Tax=Steinernema glaseri TaxID=37863 RepID=A0A1I7ZJ67_9BILA
MLVILLKVMAMGWSSSNKLPSKLGLEEQVGITHSKYPLVGHTFALTIGKEYGCKSLCICPCLTQTASLTNLQKLQEFRKSPPTTNTFPYILGNQTDEATDRPRDHSRVTVLAQRCDSRES